MMMMTMIIKILIQHLSSFINIFDDDEEEEVEEEVIDSSSFTNIFEDGNCDDYAVLVVDDDYYDDDNGSELSSKICDGDNGRKEMFYLMTYTTYSYLWLYGVGHMVQDHSDSERANPLPPHGLLFPINTRVILYAPFHRQDNTYHGLCYTSHGALAGTRNSSMSPP